MNATLPGAIWTCTSTARASMPSNATVETRMTIRRTPVRSAVCSESGRNAIVFHLMV